MSKSINFESPQQGWSRASKKYLQKEDKLSPIKPTICNTEPVDIYKAFKHSIWILSMSEQFYYDNSLLLLSEFIEKSDPNIISAVLMANKTKLSLSYIKRFWTKVVELGSGSYGTVAKIYDSRGQLQFALKYVGSKRSSNYYDEIISYFKERNAIIKAHESPFVVTLYNAFALDEFTGHFFMFEYCIGDLIDLLQLMQPVLTNKPLIELYLPLPGYYETLYKDGSSNLKFDILHTFKIYTFEMLAMLDHLAKCNIVHCDIKLDNIMISKHCHLKLGDFGLVNNVNFITEPSRVKFFNDTNYDSIEKEREQQRRKGTTAYMDMELLVNKLKDEKPLLIDKLLKSDIVDGFDQTDYGNDFLSDLWATARTIVFMMFCADFSVDKEVNLAIPLDALPDYARNCEYMRLIYMTVSKKGYDVYFKQGLVENFKDIYGDLPKFLIECFKPRKYRASDYVNEKEVLIYDKRKTVKYLNISAIEEIDIFKQLNFNTNNVFLNHISKNVLDLLKKKPNKEISIVDYLTKISNKERHLTLGYKKSSKLRPGADIQTY